MIVVSATHEPIVDCGPRQRHSPIVDHLVVSLIRARELVWLFLIQSVGTRDGVFSGEGHIAALEQGGSLNVS